MSINHEVKVMTGIILSTILVMFLGVYLFSQSINSENERQLVSQDILVKTNSQATGPTEASVTVVEFLDYQCPSCAAIEPSLAQLREKYQGRVNFVYRHYPLSSHQHAFLAAEALEAARTQGQFAAMHERLYTEQNLWSEFDSDKQVRELFKQYAKELNLDSQEFSQALENSAHRSQILADIADGNRAGVTGTPHFFVNGENLGSSLAAVEAAIEAQLQSN